MLLSMLEVPRAQRFLLPDDLSCSAAEMQDIRDVSEIDLHVRNA